LVLPTTLQETLLAIISIFFGLISAISGGGGGLFVVPSMIAIFTDPHSVLLGSVFVGYLVAAIAGFFSYARKGLIDYKNGVFLAVPTVPGVVIGTLLEANISDFEFKLGLGLITICLSLGMYLSRPKVSDSMKRENTALPDSVNKEREELDSKLEDGKNSLVTDASGRVFKYRPKIVRGMLINFAAGLLSGTFGAGAAVIIVPSMVMFVKMPSHVAIASSRIVLIALNLSAVVSHVSFGAINFLYALILSCGAIVGIYFGTKIVFKTSPMVLTKIMVVIFTCLGIYLIVSSF
jgi:uncharacterized membrane protein YfcA